LANNKITHILLHKIGLTKNSPEKRVHTQELKNGESYQILKFYATKYYKYVEMVAHRLFKDHRVQKTDSRDGNTEWFLIGQEELLKGMDGLAKAMHFVYGDQTIWKEPQA
jgi:hypothetical protein